MAKESISASISLKDGTDIANIVIMPGDPLRAKYVAETYLENPVLFNDVRNMLGYTGTYKGRKISVMGHGMGIPSAALYLTELFDQFGVDSVIRIGSAGGISDDMKLGDVLVAIGASSNSGYGDQIDLPGHLAAVADYGMLENAVNAAREMEIPVTVGKVYTSDYFYHPDPHVNEKARDLGHMAVEMEVAGFYWTAALKQKKAVAFLTVSDNVFTGEAMSAQERQESFDNMMKVALETAWKEAKEA